MRAFEVIGARCDRRVKLREQHKDSAIENDWQEDAHWEEIHISWDIYLERPQVVEFQTDATRRWGWKSSTLTPGVREDPSSCCHGPSGDGVCFTFPARYQNLMAVDTCLQLRGRLALYG